MSNDSKKEISKSLKKLVEIKEAEFAMKMADRELLSIFLDELSNNLEENKAEDEDNEEYQDCETCPDREYCPSYNMDEEYDEEYDEDEITEEDCANCEIEDCELRMPNENMHIGLYHTFNPDIDIEIDFSKDSMLMKAVTMLKKETKKGIQETVMRSISPENYTWIIENYSKCVAALKEEAETPSEIEETGEKIVNLSPDEGFNAVKDALVARMVTLLFDTFHANALFVAITFFVYAETERRTEKKATKTLRKPAPKEQPKSDVL